MFNIADLIIIIVIGISAFVSYKKGFTKTFIKLISFFVAIILALLLYKPMAQFLKDNTQIDEWIVTNIVRINSEKEEENIESKEEINEKSIQETIDNLPQNIKDSIGIEEIKDQAVETVTENLVNSILNIISMIGIYVIARLILVIVCFVLDGIMQIPVLKQINELLGLVLGILLGIIQIYTICAIITFLAQIVDLNSIVEYINSSLIAKMMYNNNLLIALIF